jgi:hypothetical protein
MFIYGFGSCSEAKNREVRAVPSPELTDFDAELGPFELPGTDGRPSVATIAEPADQSGSAAGSEQGKTAEGPACEKCHTPLTGKQGWCRRCGWYPRLGTFVELDPWDREDLPQPKPKSKLEACKTLIPKWGWMLIGGVVLILVASFVLRLILPRGNNIRFYWTLGQMGLGELIFWGAHLACFLFATMRNDRIQLLDILLKPLAIWATVIRELPSTFWHVATGLWAMTAVLGGFIVGGLADRDLLDWGGTPARYNLTKAIADRAQELAANAKTDKTLEESIEDFAGKAAEKAPEHKPDPLKLAVDCLIVGFKPAGDSDFISLILATEVGGKLKIVGTVSDGITPEMRTHLNKRMKELRQPNPFIPCRYEGKWIRPGLVCKVKAKKWSDDNRLIEPVFEEMLVDVDSQEQR